MIRRERKREIKNQQNSRRIIKEIIRSSGEGEEWREDSEGDGGGGEEAGEEEKEVEEREEEEEQVR